VGKISSSSLATDVPRWSTLEHPASRAPPRGGRRVGYFSRDNRACGAQVRVRSGLTEVLGQSSGYVAPDPARTGLEDPRS
jgi:hypothetical protein